VHVRDATPTDASVLVSFWADPTSRAGETQGNPQAEAEASAALARIAAEPDERLLVGLVDDSVVGAMHLRRGPLSPIHSGTAIHTSYLNVLEPWRRHGVGRALVEAAVSWAEEKDTTHVLAASMSNSREANRFMARLGLAPIASVRAAPVQLLRAKLPGEAGALARISPRSHHQLSQVLANRRLQRRSQNRTK
jgi:GNAT superfamily N-acetyltransferase